MESLAVIIPVYNEEAIIETVIKSWVSKLDELKINYKIFIYNNDSTDSTGKILEDIIKNNSNITEIKKQNDGHGPSVLKGYKDNAPNFNWIFQIDSDNEMSPEFFHHLWEKRLEYDFLIAKRVGRIQNLSRKLISFFSRLCVNVLFGFGIWDVNCPYRLMKSETFIELFNRLPDNTVSPNIVIAGFVASKKINFYEYPIPCEPRKTGKVSLQKLTLLKVSIKSFLQAIMFSLDKI